MIKIFSLYDQYLITDITKYCKTVQISGDTNQCARKLDLTLVYSIYDKNQPNTQIGCGTLVWVVDDVEGEIFRGIVFNRELSSTNETKVTAYDYLIYFLKSKASYNFNSASPEIIVKKVCEEVGVETGDVEPTGININLIVQGQSLYDIMMKAYTQVSKQNGKKYIPVMNGKKLEIIEKGKILSAYTLDTDINIIQANYSDNMDNMINKVKIEDENGNTTGIVESSDWVKIFGTFQEVYKVEENQDSNAIARNMLHAVDNQISIEALGNIKCRTGYGVNVKIPWLDITSKGISMYIDSDSHTWEVGSGKYTMQLTLNFKNTMDEKGD